MMDFLRRLSEGIGYALENKVELVFSPAMATRSGISIPPAPPASLPPSLLLRRVRMSAF
jgi:hypothetical protein